MGENDAFRLVDNPQDAALFVLLIFLIAWLFPELFWVLR